MIPRGSSSEWKSQDDADEEDDLFHEGVFPRIPSSTAHRGGQEFQPPLPSASLPTPSSAGSSDNGVVMRPNTLPSFTAPWSTTPANAAGPTWTTMKSGTARQEAPSYPTSAHPHPTTGHNQASASSPSIPMRRQSSQTGGGPSSASPPLRPSSPAGGGSLNSNSNVGTPHAATAGTAAAAAAAAAANGSVSGNEELWMSIERYLLATYTALHEDDEEQLRPFKTPKHRMGWYAIVYNACNGNPANSRELYARLALAILHALEALVLYPMLQHADRSRLVLITGQEGAVMSGAGKSSSSGEKVKDGAKASTPKNASFRFVRRLFFGDADSHHRDRSRSSSAKGSSARKGDPQPLPSMSLSVSAMEPASPTNPSVAAAAAVAAAGSAPSPSFAHGSPLHQSTSPAPRYEDVSTPLHLRGSDPCLPLSSASPQAPSHESPSFQQRQESLYEVNFGHHGITDDLSPPRGPTPHSQVQQRRQSGGASNGPLLSRQQSSSLAGAAWPMRTPSPAPVAEDTGRVVVDEEEELLLPEVSRTPPESSVTLPSTPVPSTHKRGSGGGTHETVATSSVIRVGNTTEDHENPSPHRSGTTTTKRDTLASSSADRPDSTATTARAASSPSAERTADRTCDEDRSCSAQRDTVPKAEYSACDMFCKEYATFAVFRRIVLSCFRYLDQYYTRRYGMDTLTMMCVKLFYVIVYEPVKPLLVDELFRKLARLREARSEGHARSGGAPGFPHPVGLGVGSSSGGGGGASGDATASTGADVAGDIRLIQQTLSVITELTVAVQTTSSYLVAGELPAATAGATASSGAAGSTANTSPAGGGNTSGRQSPAIRGLAGRGATSSGSRTGSVSPAAAVTGTNASFAADGRGADRHGMGGPVASASAPTSAASTPRFRPFDLLTRSPGTPTAAFASSSLSTPVAPSPMASGHQGSTTQQQQQQQPSLGARDTKRRRLMDIFKVNHHNNHSASNANGNNNNCNNNNNSSTSLSGPEAASHRASPSTEMIDATAALASHFAPTDTKATDEPRPARPSPITSQENAAGDAGGFLGEAGGSTRPTPSQVPLIVDLRGTLEVRNRLGSRSLAHSLANQAMRHSELSGSTNAGSNASSVNAAMGVGAGGMTHLQPQQQQQQQLPTGTIIKEIGKPLANLIGDDFGDTYMLQLEHFYRAERPRQMDASFASRRRYTRWVRSVFSLERCLVIDVGLPFIHAAIQAVLSSVLLVEVHRTLILDTDSGFQRLLEVWAGDRTDDGLVIAVLGEDVVQESSSVSNGHHTTSAAFSPSASLVTVPSHSRTFSNSLEVLAGGHTAANHMGALRSPENMALPNLPRNSMHARTLSSSAISLMNASTASTAAFPPPNRLVVTAQEKCAAVGSFYSTFAMSGDESCTLLMAAVLARKIIRDAAELISAYLSTIARTEHGGRGVSGKGEGPLGLDGTRGGFLSGLPTYPSRASTSFASTHSSRTNRSLGKAPSPERGMSHSPSFSHVPGASAARPAPSAEAALAAAGNTLAEGLVKMYTAYSTLIQEHMLDSPVMLGALTDAMVVVLNPSRWTRSAAAAAAATASAASEMHYDAAGVSGLGGRGSPRQWGASPGWDMEQLPNVLLNRDAGARATAPLLAILESEPRAASMGVPVLMATYCDHLCGRQLAGRLTEVTPEMQERLAHIAVMVALLDDKDIFLEYYKERLARRLLAASANIEAERVFVQQLQLRLGVSSVHAFEAMLRDCINARNNTAEFEKTDKFKSLPTKIVVQLLSSAQWPSYRALPLKPHPTLLAGMSAFEDYYLRVHPSRTLRWLHVLGTAKLTAEFPRGTKEVLANTIQASILLLVSEAYNHLGSAAQTITGAHGSTAATDMDGMVGEFTEDTRTDGATVIREGQHHHHHPHSHHRGGTTGDGGFRRRHPSHRRTDIDGAVEDEDVPAEAESSHPSERSPTASFYTSEDDDDNESDLENANDDTAKDMHTIPSIPSSLHGGLEGTSPSPRDLSELVRSPPPHAQAPVAAPPPAAPSAPSGMAALGLPATFASANAPRISSLLAHLASSALTTYRGTGRAAAADSTDEEAAGDEDERTEERVGMNRAAGKKKRHRGYITGDAIARKLGMTFAELRPHLASVVAHRGVPLLRCLDDTSREEANQSFSTGVLLTASNSSSGTSPSQTPSAVPPRTLEAHHRFALNERFSHRLRKIQLPAPRLRRVATSFAVDGVASPQSKVWALGSGTTTMQNSSTMQTASLPAAADTDAGEAMGEGGGEAFTGVPAAIQAMRRQQLAAALVRALKSHRELAYADLVPLVTQLVARHFRPTAREIKRELDVLVEREFVSRSTEHDTTFVYNA